MDRNAVLAKTAKGLEEVKSRAHGLAQKQRTILIMVDGLATVGEILAKFGGIAEIAASLDALARDGFVEIKSLKGGAALSAAATAPAPATAGPATVPQTRGAALTALTRFLHDNLGPDADLVTGNLERREDAGRVRRRSGALRRHARRDARTAEGTTLSRSGQGLRRRAPRRIIPRLRSCTSCRAAAGRGGGSFQGRRPCFAAQLQ